jgi:hypothetical protein
VIKGFVIASSGFIISSYFLQRYGLFPTNLRISTYFYIFRAFSIFVWGYKKYFVTLHPLKKAEELCFGSPSGDYPIKTK